MSQVQDLDERQTVFVSVMFEARNKERKKKEECKKEDHLIRNGGETGIHPAKYE